MISNFPLLFLVSIMALLSQAFLIEHRSLVTKSGTKANRDWIKHFSSLRPASVLSNDAQPNGVSVTKESHQLGNDSMEKFSSDLRKVLKELRPSDEDPEVPGEPIYANSSLLMGED